MSSTDDSITVVSGPTIGGLGARFAGHRELRAGLDAVLEGRLGTLWCSRSAARADVGCYAFFGGNAHTPGARALVHAVAPPRELLWGTDSRWLMLIREIWGPRVTERPMRAFDARGLERPRLERLATSGPQGYAIVPLDQPLAEQLDGDMHPHALQVFDDARSFVAHGLGHGAVRDGRLACAATSYTITSTAIELAIATRRDHRRRGLATATAASLAAACLARGLVPQWNAANETSERVALRLGFRRAGRVEILYLS